MDEVMQGKSATLQAGIAQRDWEMIAHMAGQTAGMHGLPIFNADDWYTLKAEAAKDGVDLDALARAAEQWG